MIRWVCDTPERIPARIYSRVLEEVGGCPCCAFWRAACMGALFGFAVSGVVALVLHHFS